LALAFVALVATALLVIYRPAGNGVQLLGHDASNRSSTSATESAPQTSSDSQISPLLQPPQPSHPEQRSLALRHKPKSSAGVGNPHESAAAATAPDSIQVPPLPNDTGEAELANGLQYLRADGGTTETNVAIKWLWAAVEKGNTKAAIILADLYGWGRGVPQNCDQARVLLLAASRRGSTEAQERLQDMEAEGCSNQKPSSK